MMLHEQKKASAVLRRLRRNKSLAATYSSILLSTVPLAMKGLTSEFGMGSGIPPSL